MNSSIYIKGDDGFKTAVLSKLGGTWIHGVEHYDQNTLAFSLPENIAPHEIKEIIGSDSIAKYNLMFLNNPLENVPAEEQPKVAVGQPIKMSIWANKDYNLQGR